MPGQKHLRAYIGVQLPPWRYLGSEGLTLDGVNTQNLTIPDAASIVEIRAEGGEIYFQIDGIATALSGGYIPEDQAETIGPLSTDWTSLAIYSTTASTVAHIMYWVEV